MDNIFLCYAREDGSKIEPIYQNLRDIGFNPWLCTEELLPGERWRERVQDVIEDADFCLVFLSESSFDNEGFYQEEIQYALDTCRKKPPKAIYLIPARLEPCKIPEDLAEFQYVDLFEIDGEARLIKALHSQIRPSTNENSVLVVNDEREMCRLLAEELSDADYKVTTETLGNKALGVFARNAFPVVVLDIVFEEQEIDGITILKDLLDMRPETKVIILTGFYSIDSVLEAHRLGMFDYITKKAGSWLGDTVRTVHRAFHEVWSQNNMRIQNNTPNMQSTPTTHLFYSYSHKDEELRDELEMHLTLLKRQGIISSWHDRRIVAGEEWAGQISEHLEQADIILLVVSAAFVASDYCYEIEMERALERHESGEACVIPVIIRPVDWHGAPFSILQALPKDAKAVTTWDNRDEAWVNVAQGIRQAVEQLRQK